MTLKVISKAHIRKLHAKMKELPGHDMLPDEIDLSQWTEPDPTMQIIKMANLNVTVDGVEHVGCNAIILNGKVLTDASAAKGLADSVGLSKVLHFETYQSWLQSTEAEGVSKLL